MKSKSILVSGVLLLCMLVGYGISEWTQSSIGAGFGALVGYWVLRSTPTDKIVIVMIDNASLDELARNDLRIFTFSKDIYIQLFDKLHSLGARAIGLDVVLANPDEREWALAKTLEKYNNITIAAKVWANGGERVMPRDIYPEKFYSMIDLVSENGYLRGLKVIGDRDKNSLLEPFAYRVYRLFTREPLGNWLSSTLFTWLGAGSKYQISPLRSVAVNSKWMSLIPFNHTIGGFDRISLSDVLAGRVPEGFFRDRAVLIGEYGTLIHDAHRSPLSTQVDMPGVEFHANLLDSLLSNTPLVAARNSVNWLLIFIFAAPIFWMISTRKLWINIVFMWGVLLGFLLLTWYLHAGVGILLDSWLIFCTGIFSPVVGASLFRYRSLDAKGRFLRSAFSRYISPSLVSQIVADPSALNLGGEKRELAILFSDIAGFTSISEKLGTGELFEFMSEYLSEMTDILIAHQGTLDKYIGDSVMWFFGAPIAITDPVIAACRTALAMQARLSELGPIWQARGIPIVQTRIGLHFDRVMVWNIGSKNRFNYTAIGDGVNLASRLEGVNKEYGTFICASSEVVSIARDKFLFRKLDRIRVKGRDKSVEIYELMPSGSEAKIAEYEQALTVYFTGDYTTAQRKFAAIVDDSPAAIMAVRCLSLIAGTTWLRDGVFTMQGK